MLVRQPAMTRSSAARALLFGLVIAAIIAAFLLQMAHGVCPVP
jgi:hypothetical protein